MLVAFDFDGTLSDSEMTVLLGNQNGTAEDMASITERAMNDEIEYAESLRQRCALLEDLPDEQAQAAFDEVELRPGAAEVIEALREAGHYVVILTGGFERGVEAALAKAGVEVDAIVANRLPVADGKSEAGTASEDTSGQRPRVLTGTVEGPLIEGTKDDALEVATAITGEDRAETVAVGDGANDLPMLEVAGLAVGFEPKPAVAPSCDVTVSTMDELYDLFEQKEML
ncbi:HAD family hydrolase [Haloarcula pellucida]|uniref:phosphoserine phosphatase n=1 Tax=Haloarcula pellucida TaxID=1427151 RepID=A0A830GSI7_9EURY|nr:HAD-IB family phosphatase [Halomicroarcula pellucida]MBX0349438.1 HAD-IB family phosphatase [Halomicroarcula pellucida]GGO02921.1 phosphoserine phosphatase SerB [Halomicroarcula pellucida]